jgi:hypothetical protein
MDKQITLTALETLLATKKAEQEAHFETVYNPAIKSKSTEIFSWFRDNVSNLIPKIEASSNRVEIMKSASPHGWTACTIYLESEWRSEKSYCRMNFYGSSANVSDQNILNDVQVFGAIAANLSKIEHEFINDWKPSFSAIEDGCKQLNSELYGIQDTINKLKSDIRKDGLDIYKKEGFSLSIDKYLDIDREWEKENIEYQLVEKDARIKLQTGRSNHDYVYVSTFKIIKTNKYKTTLEVVHTQYNSADKVKVRTYEVTSAKFDQFIQEVYEWQNGGSKKTNENTTIRFEKNYKTA